jgi:hypothetical protein
LAITGAFTSLSDRDIDLKVAMIIPPALGEICDFVLRMTFVEII